MEETQRFSEVNVEQLSVAEVDRANEDVDSIQVMIKFCAAEYDQHGPDGPRVEVDSEVVYTTYCRILLGLVKKKPSRARRDCRRFFAARITEKDHLINIPRKAHSLALQKLFEALDAAVEPERPIQLEIWDHIVNTWEEQPPPYGISFVPATRDSIDGLERVRLQVVGGEECAICLEDYDVQPGAGEVVVTRLPCAHYFHTDCAALWLHTHHICPMCRFALPTTP